MPIKRYIPNSIKKMIFERDGKKCSICGIETRFFHSGYDTPYDNAPKSGSVDHIIPFSKGGTNNPDNLRWTCRSCNCARGNRV